MFFKLKVDRLIKELLGNSFTITMEDGFLVITTHEIPGILSLGPIMSKTNKFPWFFLSGKKRYEVIRSTYKKYLTDLNDGKVETYLLLLKSMKENKTAIKTHSFDKLGGVIIRRFQNPQKPVPRSFTI